MGFIRKVASIMMLGGVSSTPGASRRGRPNGPGRRPRGPGKKPRRPRPCGPRLRRRWPRNRPRYSPGPLLEDEAHRQADLREVAEKEAEAVKDQRPSYPARPVRIVGT